WDGKVSPKAFSSPRKVIAPSPRSFSRVKMAGATSFPTPRWPTRQVKGPSSDHPVIRLDACPRVALGSVYRRVEFILLSTYAYLMALSIKSPEVEKLVDALTAMTGESKTEAIRRALIERRERLSLQHVRHERGSDFLRYLKEEVWPK